MHDEGKSAEGIHVLYLHPSAFSVCLSEHDVGVCLSLMCVSKITGIQGMVCIDSISLCFRHTAVCLWCRGGSWVCLESAADGNRMSWCYSVERAPQISGSRCSFRGQHGSAGLWHPCWCCLGSLALQRKHTGE